MKMENMQMKTRFQLYSTKFQPKLIAYQLMSMICIFYQGQIIISLFLDFTFGMQFHLGQIFDFEIFLNEEESIQVYNYAAIAYITTFLNIFIMNMGLILVIVKGNKVLDFVSSVYIFHIIICYLASTSKFNYRWLIINSIAFLITTIVGEYICIRIDQQDIYFENLFKIPKNAKHKKNDDAKVEIEIN